METESSHNKKRQIQLIKKFEAALQSGKLPFFEEEDLCLICDHYLTKEDFNGADYVINLGLKIYPNSSELLVCKVKYLIANKNFKEAQQIIDKEISFPDDEQEIGLLKARILYELGKKDEAFDIFRYLIENEKENKDEIYCDIAYIFSEMRIFSTAISFFKKSLSIKHENIEALFELAFCYQQTGDFEKAEEAYESILDINP